jgi:hypothetical protein
MTDGLDNTIASDEEAEKLARGDEDIDPGPEENGAEGVAANDEDSQDSSDAADTMVSDQDDSDPAPK